MSDSNISVSALIIAAPCAQHDVELDFVDSVTVSRPYIELTLQCVRAFGASADWTPGGGLRIAGGNGYQARDYAIEPDASAAVYPLCAAALAATAVRARGPRFSGEPYKHARLVSEAPHR